MANTPLQKWKQAIVAHRKKCQKIIGLSKSIRYVGVINEYGRTLTGLVQPGVKPFFSAEQVKNEFFIISTLMTLRKPASKALGSLDFVLLNHNKVTVVAFQRKDKTYYVSVNANTKDIGNIIIKIKKIL